MIAEIGVILLGCLVVILLRQMKQIGSDMEQLRTYVYTKIKSIEHEVELNDKMAESLNTVLEHIKANEGKVSGVDPGLGTSKSEAPEQALTPVAPPNAQSQEPQLTP
jgi:hypothetical protein